MEKAHSHGDALRPLINDADENSAAARHYHYKQDELIVAEDDRDRVTKALQRQGMGVWVCNPLDGLGVCVLHLDQPRKSVPSIVRELRGNWDRSVPKVGPNHVFQVLTHTMRTAFPPRPPSRPVKLEIPSRAGYQGVQPVVIGLLDSGYDRSNGRLDASCRGDEEKVPKGDGPLPLGVGHGTFVASKLLQQAPAARIEVHDVINDQSFVDDGTLAAAIRELSDPERGDVKVLHISVGSSTEDDAGALAVEDALRYVRFNRPDMVVVAPAGNDASERPIFPAAYKGVIGVGAVERIDHEWRPACFTSFGWWVDACAPGVDVLGAFLKYTGTLERPEELPYQLVERCGRYVDKLFAMGLEEQVEDFDRVALWSGTSVAAPVVAGRIAARMQAGASADSAVREILSASGKSIQGLGALVE